MKRLHKLGLIVLLACLPSLAFSGVKHVTKTKMKFHGFMGTMMKFAGGDKPKMTALYVQGMQQRSDDLDQKGKLMSSTVVDLDKELFINIDHKKKEYSVMSFAEWKEQMERMPFFGGGTKQPENDDRERPEVKVDFKIDVDRTGKTKKIAGYKSEEFVVTMKGEGEVEDTQEKQGGTGGMIITSNQWISKELEGYDEIAAFGKVFAEKMGMLPTAKGLEGVLSTVMKNNPELAKSIEKLNEQAQGMEGFTVSSKSVFQTYGDPNQKPGEMESDNQEMPKSVGGLLGGFGKKFGKKKSDGPSTLFEMETETVEYKNGTLKAALFAPPQDYEKVEKKSAY